MRRIRPDYIPEEREHLWTKRRDPAGRRRDFLPEATPEPEPEPEKRKGAR